MESLFWKGKWGISIFKFIPEVDRMKKERIFDCLFVCWDPLGHAASPSAPRASENLDSPLQQQFQRGDRRLPLLRPSSKIGGLARRGTWVKEIREARKDILLLDAGDTFFNKYAGPVQGNQVKMLTARAHLFIESLNLMGYDALGIGDDNLTLGKDFLVDLSKRAKFPFPPPIRGRRIEEAGLSVLYRQGGKRHPNRNFQSHFPRCFFGLRGAGAQGIGHPKPGRNGPAYDERTQSEYGSRHSLEPPHLSQGHGDGPDRDRHPFHRGGTFGSKSCLSSGHEGYRPPSDSDQGNVCGSTRSHFLRRRIRFLQYRDQPISESNLANLKLRMNGKDAQKTGKEQYQKLIGDTERSIKQFEGKNRFPMRSSPLQIRSKRILKLQSGSKSIKRLFRSRRSPLLQSGEDGNPRT